MVREGFALKLKGRTEESEWPNRRQDRCKGLEEERGRPASQARGE